MSLARLATKRAKPDGWFRLTWETAEEFMSPLPVRELKGIGWRVGAC